MAALDGPRPKAVLVACGSFNPPTVMHLRMFDLAAHHLRQLGWDVVAQYMSPVGDAYKKPGLSPAHHRLRMCTLAAAAADNIKLDPWEAAQPDYTRTMDVLKHIQERELAAAAAADTGAAEGAAASASGSQAPAESAASPQAVRVMLLCGSDLLASMDVPGLWEAPEALLEQHGVVCIARYGTDVEQLLACAPGQSTSVLCSHGQHVMLVVDPVGSMISSSAIRKELAAGAPVRYLLPDSVLEYIMEHKLYLGK